MRRGCSGRSVPWPREGVAVIFVSHRYGEVLELCDAVTVLRNGQVVHDGGTDGMTVDRLVELTLGQRVESVFTRSPIVSRGSAMSTWPSTGCARPVWPRRSRSPCGAARSSRCTARWDPDTPSWPASSAVTRGARPARSASAACTRRPRRDVPRRRIGIVPDNRMDNALFPELKVRSNVSVASVWKARTRPLRADPLRTPRTRAGRPCGGQGPGRHVGARARGPRAQWRQPTEGRAGPLADARRRRVAARRADPGRRRRRSHRHLPRDRRPRARRGRLPASCRATPRRWRRLADRALVFFKGAVVADLRGDAINDRNLLAASQGRRSLMQRRSRCERVSASERAATNGLRGRGTQ